VKAVAVYELSYKDLKSKIEDAVVSILKRHRGSTAYISLRQIIRRAGLLSIPAYNTVVIEVLKNLEKININGRTWRLAEITRQSDKMRFVYRRCFLITDFLGDLIEG